MDNLQMPYRETQTFFISSSVVEQETRGKKWALSTYAGIIWQIKLLLFFSFWEKFHRKYKTLSFDSVNKTSLFPCLYLAHSLVAFNHHQSRPCCYASQLKQQSTKGLFHSSCCTPELPHILNPHCCECPAHVPAGALSKQTDLSKAELTSKYG